MKMKLFFVGLLILFSSNTLAAKDFETPHTFSPGDVISADVVNEVFSKLEDVNRSISKSDLVGTWSCTSYSTTQMAGAVVSGWVLSSNNLHYTLEGASITFSDDGGGSYSLTTSAPSPLKNDSSTSISSDYDVIANALWYRH